VNGTLHLDGTLSANGLTGGNAAGGGSGGNAAGGGSGGSIWISANTLVGGGSISALGGTTSPVNGAAGGGGRIAIWAWERNGYAGTVTTSGYSSGTIYMSATSAEMVVPQFEISGGNVKFTVQPSVMGRRYQLQYSNTMDIGTWQDLGSVRVGDGNNLVITTPYNPAEQRCFYRLSLDATQTP